MSRCATCGTPASGEPWSAGLCVTCLLRLASDPADEPTAQRLEHAGDGPRAGDILADRYRVFALLGRGGMGEVWLAYDLKLRTDVALKGTFGDALPDERARDMLRGEVRAAREVISPNVCRLFDVIEADGRELVAMEYVEGRTLRQLLEERGALHLHEAAEIASQMLTGLDAIHSAGLVHRDIKPENLMLTPAGRVVIMDFGLSGAARRAPRAGTPGYMAPEQERGELTDARADVYAAGRVLSDLVASTGRAGSPAEGGEGSSGAESWNQIVARATATTPEDRFASAAELARALERVAAAAQIGDIQPYPGLAAFTPEQAPVFYGREAEVEEIWRRLGTTPLVGLIGPSGAGKTSLLRAGVLATIPSGWSGLWMTPGPAPLRATTAAIAAATGSELAAATDESDVLEAVRGWRATSASVLIVVDQFEELFTQAPESERAAFVRLLDEALAHHDVHVLLTMRDDFLMRCHAYTGLRAVFASLVPIAAPSGAELRRALVQPALRSGYRFESEDLVAEMLAGVGGERSALPLLAFTASRLWQERDREQGLLRADAYARIGGVGGALAQHAEETMSAIGPDRTPLVREIFRNLVTADGTRAAADREQLLSVFEAGERCAAADVVDRLIDARLITSYEPDAGRTSARLELIHESLLSHWPRLERWRHQDAEGAVLRDELREAARIWESRGRPDDLLWSGTALAAFRLWRERYPGRLSALEERFAEQMEAAADRMRRRRRKALVAVVAGLAVVAVAMTVLWRRSVAARDRADAQRMVAAATLAQLDEFPTAALAWAMASLEVADTEAARRLAVQALWKGPPAWILTDVGGVSAAFSPDGRFLLQTVYQPPDGRLLRVFRADGTEVELPPGPHTGSGLGAGWVAGEEAQILTLDLFHARGAQWARWSVDPPRLLGETIQPYSPGTAWNAAIDRLVTLYEGGELVLDPMTGAPPTRTLLLSPGDLVALSAAGDRIARWRDGAVERFDVTTEGTSLPRRVGDHSDATSIRIGRDGTVVTRSDDGAVRLWDSVALVSRRLEGPAGAGDLLSVSSDGGVVHLRVRRPGTEEYDRWVGLTKGDPVRWRNLGSATDPEGTANLDPTVRHLAVSTGRGEMVWHHLRGPDGTRPQPLHNGSRVQVNALRFDPSGRWLTTAAGTLTLWSTARPYPLVVDVGTSFRALDFDPRGRWLVARARDVGAAALWAFEERTIQTRPTVVEGLGQGSVVASSPVGSKLAVGLRRAPERGSPLVVDLDTGTVAELPAPFRDQVMSMAFSPDGRYLAAAGGQFVLEEAVIKVWDVETLQLVGEHHPEERLSRNTAGFTADGRVLWSGTRGLYAWDPRAGTHELILAGDVRGLDSSADGRRHLIARPAPATVADRSGSAELFFADLETGEVRRIDTHGEGIRHFAIDATGTVIATADHDGTVRVGPASGAEPHLLYSHPPPIEAIVVDPLRRWVVTGTNTTTIFWPMPDIDEAPLHTLPLAELLTRLRSLTNVRLVPDEASEDGWRLTRAPFPGWERIPAW